MHRFNLLQPPCDWGYCKKQLRTRRYVSFFEGRSLCAHHINLYKLVYPSVNLEAR